MPCVTILITTIGVNVRVNSSLPTSFFLKITIMCFPCLLCSSFYLPCGGWKGSTHGSGQVYQRIYRDAQASEPGEEKWDRVWPGTQQPFQPGSFLWTRDVFQSVEAHGTPLSYEKEAFVSSSTCWRFSSACTPAVDADTRRRLEKRLTSTVDL